MKSEPFNDDPDHVPVRKFDSGLVLWYLNFHRRTIFGAILVAGLIYLLVRLNDSGNDSSQLDEDPPMRVAVEPTTQQKTEFLLDSGSAERPSPIEPSAPATTDQKIDQLLENASSRSELSDADAITSLNKRIAILRELLQSDDLTPSQLSYCELDFIDTVGLLVEFSNKTDAGIEGIDDLVEEVEQGYGESEDPKLSTAAKVVFVHQAVSRFMATQSDEDFEAFKTALLERQAAIHKSDPARKYLTKAMSEAVSITGDDGRMREIAIDHLSKVADLQGRAATDLAVKLFFSDVDLSDLPTRVNSRNPSADAELLLLFDQLEKRPNMPVPIYSIAASSIARYQDIGEKGKAEQCLVRLRAIAPRISIDKIRNQVQNGIDSLGAKQ